MLSTLQLTCISHEILCTVCFFSFQDLLYWWYCKFQVVAYLPLKKHHYLWRVSVMAYCLVDLTAHGCRLHGCADIKTKSISESARNYETNIHTIQFIKLLEGKLIKKDRSWSKIKEITSSFRFEIHQKVLIRNPLSIQCDIHNQNRHLQQIQTNLQSMNLSLSFCFLFPK